MFAIIASAAASGSLAAIAAKSAPLLPNGPTDCNSLIVERLKVGNTNAKKRPAEDEPEDPRDERPEQMEVDSERLPSTGASRG